MAKYSDIKGFTVQTLSTDPVDRLADLGSWASGGSLNTRRFSPGGTGTASTQSAMLVISGDRMPTEPRMVDETEH